MTSKRIEIQEQRRVIFLSSTGVGELVSCCRKKVSRYRFLTG